MADLKDKEGKSGGFHLFKVDTDSVAVCCAATAYGSYKTKNACWKMVQKSDNPGPLPFFMIAEGVFLISSVTSFTFASLSFLKRALK